jgi:hypothetical protein
MSDPMNLKDLPSYIRSIQEEGSYGDSVVNMGQITVRPNYFRKFAFTAVACLLLVGVITYNSTQEITIVANQGVSSKDIADLVSVHGAQVVSIKQDENSYKIRIFAFKPSSLLDKLRSNKMVDSASMESD